MKKLWILVALCLLFAACGANTTPQSFPPVPDAEPAAPPAEQQPSAEAGAAEHDYDRSILDQQYWVEHEIPLKHGIVSIRVPEGFIVEENDDAMSHISIWDDDWREIYHVEPIPTKFMNVYFTEALPPQLDADNSYSDGLEDVYTYSDSIVFGETNYYNYNGYWVECSPPNGIATDTWLRFYDYDNSLYLGFPHIFDETSELADAATWQQFCEDIIDTATFTPA